MQLNISLTMPASPPVVARRFTYAGIALYESIVPGMVGYQSLAPQLNGLPPLPAVTPKVNYYWPACANAALATMNRNLYPTATATSKASIDSLEAANTVLYLKESTAEELNRSAEFGRQIATVIFEWSKSDGNDNTTPYTPPVGLGLWVPTPPAFAPAVLTNWGKNRLFVKGSDIGAEQGPPTPYSEDPASAYYAQAKELYDISHSLTAEQKTIALFWADNSWFDILNQVLAIEKPGMGVAAVAFAQVGIAMSDAAISLLKEKYRYNAIRPITYIRTVMNQPTWNTVIPTPAHPEYPSGHSVMSAAAAQTLTLLFGTNYKYLDTPYHLVNVKPRSYNSFEEAAIEAGDSRVYAGIHYRKTCDVSQPYGKKIAHNIANILKFKK
ncbi:vanadium-dependent haloperoxidase [Spirosoma endbachense]|nr:vanadium-dependent haloperoxidase [Spirosoma endbachense]